MSDHPELENSVAAFVLGAAPEAEMTAVRAHLEGCAECRQLAARLQRAAAALPLATDLVEPPARLRSRILAAAAASARTPSARPPSRARILPLRRGDTPGRVWRPDFAPSFETAAVAALLLAAIGLGGWNLQLASQVNHRQVAPAVGKATWSGRARCRALAPASSTSGTRPSRS